MSWTIKAVLFEKEISWENSTTNELPIDMLCGPCSNLTFEGKCFSKLCLIFSITSGFSYVYILTIITETNQIKIKIKIKINSKNFQINAEAFDGHWASKSSVPVFSPLLEVYFFRSWFTLRDEPATTANKNTLPKVSKKLAKENLLFFH